jgi:GH25 family lysozyme M1 (1,4-beta-N-acetylmuramidase)
MTEQAVDVSSYQGVVDWNAEKAAGVVLGIAKATEGTGWNDPYFDRNWFGMAAAGLIRGAYHFGHPGDQVSAEVDHFLGRVGALGGTDKLWLDIEANDGSRDAAGWSHAFMELLEARTGGDPRRVGIYTGKWFIDSNGGPAAWTPCTRWGLWISYYAAVLPAGATAPWSSAVLWQNTSSARMPGVHGVADASIIENGGYFSAALGLVGQPSTGGFLRLGSTGADVQDMQRKLGVAADGIFGPQTLSAVLAFQAAHGLVPDGIVGPLTRAALAGPVPAPTAPAPAPPPAPARPNVPPFPGQCQQGSTGDATRQVQARLAARGWHLAVDGSFGPATRAIVVAFQREKGLAQDGVAGPATWNALWLTPIT